MKLYTPGLLLLAASGVVFTPFKWLLAVVVLGALGAAIVYYSSKQSRPGP